MNCSKSYTKNYQKGKGGIIATEAIAEIVDFSARASAIFDQTKQFEQTQVVKMCVR